MQILNVAAFMFVYCSLDVTSEDLALRARTYSDGLIECYKNQEIASAPANLNLVTKRNADRHYWDQVQVIGLGKRFKLEFRDSDKVLIKFFDDDEFHRIAYSSNATRPEPTRDASEVERLSRKYLSIFQLDLLFNELSEPKVEFTVEERLGRRFSDGYWSVTYTRMFNKHRFLEDEITLEITEKGLLSALVVYRISEFKGIQGEPMEKDRAIRIAERTLPVYLNCPLLSALRKHPVKNVEPGDAQLLIVQPNNLLHEKRVHEVVKQKEAVLSWQIIEKVSFQGIDTELYLTMWLDAVTGEPLGGDFMPFRVH